MGRQVTRTVLLRASSCLSAAVKHVSGSLQLLEGNLQAHQVHLTVLHSTDPASQLVVVLCESSQLCQEARSLPEVAVAVAYVKGATTDFKLARTHRRGHNACKSLVVAMMWLNCCLVVNLCGAC